MRGGTDMSNRKRFFRALFNRKIVAVALVVILFFLICAVASPLLATHDPNLNDLYSVTQGPSSEHILGTDQLGRDVYSRIVYGARVAFLVGILAVLISAVLGSAIGLVAGYFGGWIDNVLMRIVEAMMAIPPVVLALALVAIFGRSVPMLILVLGISNVPSFARMMRGQVLTVRDLDYVSASRIRGNSDFTTMVKHILPNCLAPVIVQATLGVAFAILTAAGLSFIGLGIEPPTPEWGAMLSNAREYIRDYSYMTLFPGLAIAVTIFSLNVLGDGLRDALDPKLRQ